MSSFFWFLVGVCVVGYLYYCLIFLVNRHTAMQREDFYKVKHASIGVEKREPPQKEGSDRKES